MRKLNLTQQQVELILQALGMAERTMSNIHTDIIQRTTLVRGVTLKPDSTFFVKACEFADLNVAIAHRQLDEPCELTT